MLSGGGVADAATAARHGSWTVLSGPAGDNTWLITTANGGVVAANTFLSFENLVGGPGNDTYAFQLGGSISGKNHVHILVTSLPHRQRCFWRSLAAHRTLQLRRHR